jgi:hypothetical protein
MLVIVAPFQSLRNNFKKYFQISSIQNGHTNLDDAVLTGLQFRNFDKKLSIVAYGRKFRDHNEGSIEKEIFIQEVNATSSNIEYKFSSTEVDLSIKAPLSGVSLYQDSNHMIIPRLITYGMHKFIENTDIDHSFAEPMSKFARQQIRQMIHKKKAPKNQVCKKCKTISCSAVVMMLNDDDSTSSITVTD